MKQRMRAVIVLLIIGLAEPAPVLAQASRVRVPLKSQPPAENRIDGKAVFATFRQAHPEVFKEAYNEALARGWKPTDSFEGYKEHSRPGAVRKRPSGGMQDEYMSGWDGDISIWYWKDSNTANVEYWITVRSYETGEDLMVEGSYRPWSDYDGANDWFQVKGGSRWTSLGERTRYGKRELDMEKQRLAQVALMLMDVQLTTEQRRCQRRCLSSKMANVARTAAWATGASIVGCGRAAAMSGPGFGMAFFGCVGVGALVGTGAGLVSQFMISEDCKTQCGI